MQALRLPEDGLRHLPGLPAVAAGVEAGGAGEGIEGPAEAAVDGAVLVEALVEGAGLPQEDVPGQIAQELRPVAALAPLQRWALEAQEELGGGDLHPAGDLLLVDGLRLVAVVPLNVRAALGGKDALGSLEDPVGADIPHHGEDHVGGGVEGLVAVVEGLGGDLGDALHRPGDGDAAGVADVEGLEELLVDLPVGVILHHADLLGDDAPLLVHAFLGEVGDGDKAEEDLQVLLKVLRAVEVVARQGAGGEGVGLGPVFRQVLHGAAVLGVEHLVL